MELTAQLDLSDDLHLRTLLQDDAALLVGVAAVSMVMPLRRAKESNVNSSNAQVTKALVEWRQA